MFQFNSQGKYYFVLFFVITFVLIFYSICPVNSMFNHACLFNVSKEQVIGSSLMNL